MVKLAHTARKQGLFEVALNTVSRIPLTNMPVSDAFSKLREQILGCLQAATQGRMSLNTGLNIINHTNLEYFSPEQTSEFFRLMGLFLAAMDNRAEANQAFSHAMQICGTYGKGWLTWGRYTDELFEKQPNERLLGLNAMGCYLEAVNCMADGARLLLSRVLQMLILDEDNAVKILDRHGKHLPEWVWVPWVPNLITFLTRPGTNVIKTILKAVITRYPQAVYYTLRSFYLERRDVHLAQNAAVQQAALQIKATATPQRVDDGASGGGGVGSSAPTPTPGGVDGDDASGGGGMGGSSSGGGPLQPVPSGLSGMIDPTGTTLTRAITLKLPSTTATPASASSTTAATPTGTSAQTQEGQAPQAEDRTGGETSSAQRPTGPTIGDGGGASGTAAMDTDGTQGAPRSATPLSAAASSTTPTSTLPSSSTVTFEAGRTVAEVRAALEKGATILGPAPDASGMAFMHADELVTHFRKAHPGLAAEMEVMLEEFIARFRARHEEEFLSTLYTLLQRCYHSITMPLDDPIPASLRDTLGKLAKKFFRKGRQGLPDAYRVAFERDFMFGDAVQRSTATSGGGEGEGGVAMDHGGGSGTTQQQQLTLREAMCRIKKWKQVLLYRIFRDPTISGRIPLYRCSSYLAAMRHEHPPAVRTSTSSTSTSSATASTTYAPTTSATGGNVTGAPSSGSVSGVGSDLTGALKAAAGTPAHHSFSSTATTTPAPPSSSSSASSTPPAGHGVNALEVPGQYSTCAGQPHPEVHAKLLGFDAHVDVFYRQNFFQRRICMLGNDGRRYYFVAQTTTAYVTRSDERVMQLHWLMNRLLEKSHQAQRRCLYAHIPVVVPITPRLRLMEDHRELRSLGEVYEGDRYARGLDPDWPVMYARDRLDDAIASAKREVAAGTGGGGGEGGGGEAGTGGGGADAQQAATAAVPPPPTPPLTPQQQQQRMDQIVRREKLSVFHELSSDKHVPRDLLLRYMHATLQSQPEALWAWQRALASQLGLSSLLCYALACGDRTPHKLVFNRQTGRVLSADMRPSYNTKGMLENPPNEDAPFRLTPNLVSVLSPLLMDGVLIVTMAITAHALVSRREITAPFLYLLLRDDILSWYASKRETHASQMTKPEPDPRQLEKQIIERVGRNVHRVMERLNHCAPPLPNTTSSISAALSSSSSSSLGGGIGIGGGGGIGSGGQQQQQQGVMLDSKVAQLVEQATRPDKIAQMNPTWMGWL